MVQGEIQNAAEDLGDVGGGLDALFELNVLVPERMALKVTADEVGTTLEESSLSVWLENNNGEGKGRDRDWSCKDIRYPAIRQTSYWLPTSRVTRSQLSQCRGYSGQ